MKLQGSDAEAGTILDQTSLGKTIWNLEEARLSGLCSGESRVRAALDWVVERHAAPNSYRAQLFAPTPDDLRDKRPLSTGEASSPSRAGTMHILGEEAARELERWGYHSGWERDRTMEAIARSFSPPEGPASPRPGVFCCRACSAARWRAVGAGRPPGWEEILADGLRVLAEHRTLENGSWRGFPFYYTLLALADMPLEEAAREARHARDRAERLLLRATADDQPHRFRRLALEWAVQ
jgi:hypothetical protein